MLSRIKPLLLRIKPLLLKLKNNHLNTELVLREFILNYQHQSPLSKAILIEKTQLLATGLEISQNSFYFSSG
ncbi:hypothetical protein BC937DRAFT_91317 [Endogone sp. FLAS-F59071]|nr:hypothetical protein BC937DRAFT_91317 [Endogone sp. FLAS-F59071]|eukprot:RUS16343.1 hypothetical protein BC937DRAFT_91317 [Endogone sp. FLAS-F59071]